MGRSCPSFVSKLRVQASCPSFVSKLRVKWGHKTLRRGQSDSWQYMPRLTRTFKSPLMRLFNDFGRVLRTCRNSGESRDRARLSLAPGGTFVDRSIAVGDEVVQDHVGPVNLFAVNEFACGVRNRRVTRPEVHRRDPLRREEGDVGPPKLRFRRRS